MLASYFINETYWDRENFHQVHCERDYKSKRELYGNYYTIRTAPPFINDYYGNLNLKEKTIGYRADFGFDFASSCEDVQEFTYKLNSDENTGMLTMHFKSGNTLGIGNIEKDCWGGLVTYLSDYEIDVKTEVIDNK